MARPEPFEIQIRLKREGRIVLGPGRAELLERVARTGSISAAAREMDMSYRHAWLLLEYTREMLGERLVETAQGGRSGGGARLTPAGRQLLQIYRKIERKAQAAARPELEALLGEGDGRRRKKPGDPPAASAGSKDRRAAPRAPAARPRRPRG